MQEPCTGKSATVFFTDSFRSDVINNLSNISVHFKTLRQAISNISNTRKRTTRDTFFQALNYRHLLSRYSIFTAQDFNNKRQELQAAKGNLLGITIDRIWDLRWQRCAPVSNVTFTLRSPFHPFFPSYAKANEIESEAPGSFFRRENLTLFRHNAVIAVYQALIGFEQVSESTLV